MTRPEPNAEPDVFHAIADPTRRRILELLSGHESTVGELAGRFEISRPAVSKHLKILYGAGLVEYTSRGRENRYAIIPDGLREVRDWLETHNRFWDEKISKLKKLLEDESDEVLDQEGS